MWFQLLKLDQDKTQVALSVNESQLVLNTGVILAWVFQDDALSGSIPKMAYVCTASEPSPESFQ